MQNYENMSYENQTEILKPVHLPLLFLTRASSSTVQSQQRDGGGNPEVTGLPISNSYNLLLLLPSNTDPGMPYEFSEPYAHLPVLLKDITLIKY